MNIKNNSIFSVILNVVSLLILIPTSIILINVIDDITIFSFQDIFTILTIFLTLLYVFIHSIKCIRTKSEIVYRQNIVKVSILILILIPINGLIMGIDDYGFDVEPFLWMSVISLSWAIPLIILNIKKLKNAVLIDLQNKYDKNTMEIS